jgi:lipopolysaccharide export system protein LptA
MRPPAIKILRGILIGIIVFVLLSVLLNALYLRVKQSQIIKKAPKMISSDLKRSVESLEIIERRGSHIRFKIRAAHSRDTRTDTSILEGIEAFDFNPDGSIHYSIQSDFAKYDQVRKLAEFSGNVRMFPDKNVELRMHSLRYDLNAHIGSASKGMQWIAPDVTGTAQDVRFFRDTDVIELDKNVQFVLKQQKLPFSTLKDPATIHATADHALCFLKKNKMVFNGNVKIESNNDGELSGEKVELSWSPDRKNIQSLELSGEASGVFIGEQERRTLDGDSILFEMSPDRSLDRIRINGRASMTQKTPAQEQTLNAAQIEVKLDPAHHTISVIRGQSAVKFRTKRGAEDLTVLGENVEAQFVAGFNYLKMVEARNQAKFSLAGGKDAASGELSAENIQAYFREWNAQTAVDRIQAAGSVQWVFAPLQTSSDGKRQPAGTLTAANMEIRYAGQGNYPDWGTASGKVVITGNNEKSSSGSSMRRLSADSMKFHFYPEKNLIREVAAEGHVQTAYSGATPISGKLTREPVETFSDQLIASFVEKDGRGYLKSAEQYGNFQYRDGSFTASAGRCEYDADTQLLQLKESPKISDERSITTGMRMKYNLKEKMLLIQGKVRTALSTQKNKALFFQSSDASSPAIILAEELQYWTEDKRFRYRSGKVLSENQQLQAEVLEIGENGDQISAQGSVHHVLSLKEEFGKVNNSGRQKADLAANTLTDIKSDQLMYLSKNNTINYRGNVIFRSKDLSLSANDLNGLFDPDTKKIKRIKAIGNVVLRHRKRICRGESADWQPELSIYEMTGNPVEVEDMEHGRSRAHRLTYYQADDRIVLGN